MKSVNLSMKSALKLVCKILTAVVGFNSILEQLK